MKKQKILFLIESLIVGGAEKVLIDIANNIDQGKFDITVCSVFKHSVYKGYDKVFEKPFKPDIKYRYLINNRCHWLYLIFNFLLARIPNILYRLFIGDKYDVAIAFYEGLPTDWIAKANLKKGKKIAWLHTSAQLSQSGKNKKELEIQNDIYNRFANIIAVSQGVANSFHELFNSKAKIEVIHNPVNVVPILKKSLQPLNIKKEIYPTFVSIGRMTEAKGYARWLRVLLNLKNKGYEFQAWIIGGGDRSRYEQFVIENKLGNNIVFLGHQDNPYPFIKAADFFICPSLIEGLSTVVIEAMILNKAIVATDCPGMKDLLEENKYGIICENNEEGIEKNIENILLNPYLKEKYEYVLSSRKQSRYFEKSIHKIEDLLNA